MPCEACTQVVLWTIYACIHASRMDRAALHSPNIEALERKMFENRICTFSWLQPWRVLGDSGPATGCIIHAAAGGDMFCVCPPC